MSLPWVGAFAPPRRLDPIDWLEAHVHLPESGAQRGARWRRSTVPYLGGILRAAVEERGVRRITIKKGAQQGLTTLILGLVGYLLVHRPTPMLWVCPTTRGAQDFAKGPLADVLRRTPVLAGVVNAPRKRGEPSSSLLQKLAPAGGSLTLAGGNSPNSYAALSVAFTVMDDADRVPESVSEEGDPVNLLVARTTAWAQPLSVFLSTPVLYSGRVSKLYAASDQRKFFLTCPRCKHADFTTFSDEAHFFVKFDNHEPRTARLRCPRCAHDIGEGARMALVRGGAWRATAAAETAGHVGFEILNTLSPFVSMASMVERFLAAHRAGPRALREFLALDLATGWKDETSSVDPASLLGRLEDY